MGIDQIAPEALRLPVRERVLLAASLWDSIEDPYEIMPELADEEAVALAVKRDEEIQVGKVKVLSHAELMRQLRGED